MPQMSPLLWLNLFILFTFMIMMMNSMNFFYKTINIEHKSKSSLKKNSWKW